MDDGQKIHPIGYVARQTGLSAHVIRAWEKRYRSVRPGRTPTGRRLYSVNDIRHLVLLQQATRCGHRIAHLSELDDESLQAVVTSSAADAHLMEDAQGGTPTPGDFLDACREAVFELDGRAFEAALNRAAVFLTRPMLFKQVIIPLMVEIGNRWADGTLKIINEHMASSILHSFLWDMLYAYRPHPTASGIVVGTPAAQWHELGALISAVTAAEAGWAVYYFGPNLPAEEIAAAAAINRAKAVALSIVYGTGEAQMLSEIKKLRRYLTKDVTLIVGGSGIRAHQANLKQIEALHVQDFTDLRDILNKLA
jgi:DNA-binding transcriptional MerR regulator/methylmalonyl-CoA mutase cobalamin-binding subunit